MIHYKIASLDRLARGLQEIDLHINNTSAPPIVDNSLPSQRLHLIHLHKAPRALESLGRIIGPPQQHQGYLVLATCS